MSFEKILYKLRDAWRGDIRRSLEGLPGYYWGEVTGPGEVLLDAVAPGSAPVPVDDLVGALVGDRVLLVLVDGAFSVVGAADRPRVPATSTARRAYVTDTNGDQTTLPYHSNPQNNALVQRQGLDVLVPTSPAYSNSAVSQRYVELNGVPRFATVAARNTAFPAPVDGQVCYVTGVGYYVRDGGVWRTVLVDTGWQNLVLQNGWVSAGPNFTPQIRREGSVVTIRGRVTGGTPGEPIFSVDEPFQSNSQMSWIVRHSSSADDAMVLLYNPSGHLVNTASTTLNGATPIPNLYVTYMVP